MDIIKRITKGENKALEELFLLYKEKIFRMALAILGDRFLAEDVVQETFLRVQQNVKSYQFRNSEREWIMTIAHNIKEEKKGNRAGRNNRSKGNT